MRDSSVWHREHTFDFSSSSSSWAINEVHTDTIAHVKCSLTRFLSLACPATDQAQPSGLIRKTQPKNSPSSVLLLNLVCESIHHHRVHWEQRSTALWSSPFVFIFFFFSSGSISLLLQITNLPLVSPLFLLLHLVERTLLSNDIPENMCNNTRVPITITSRSVNNGHDKCPLSLACLLLLPVLSLSYAPHLPLHRHIGQRMRRMGRDLTCARIPPPSSAEWRIANQLARWREQWTSAPDEEEQHRWRWQDHKAGDWISQKLIG